MIDDQATPVPLKGQTKWEETAEYKERMSNRPDAWTIAWLKEWKDEVLKAYRGACHTINMCIASVRDIEAKLKRYDERMDSLQNENRLIQARMGEVQAENTTLMKRVDDMAAWAKSMGKRNPVDEGE